MKQSHKELIEYNRKLEQQVELLSARLSAAKEQLIESEKFITVGRLASGVGHDLNNALSLIIGHAGILLNKVWVRGSLKQDLQKIHQNAVHTAHIVENFLSVARPHHSKKVLIDINHILKDCVELLKYELCIAEIKTTLNVGPNIPQILGDPQNIHRVFLSIMQNAYQSILQDESRRKGEICIRTERNGKIIKVSISSPQSDVAKESSDELSDSSLTLAKGESETELFQGWEPDGSYGKLALFNAFNIVREHGGKIYALNEEVSGGMKNAVLVVELPIADESIEKGGG